ncbi:sulfurtransferase [Planococcus salinus]|uniref:Sulfurtransferase n=1 Tax=Planococcus salinus TaxID=1848460 RepID=A0A3M8PB87_9BACL|nr:sulfurtransferase [Planococcus salinus]RNF40464.1 sulfurtransferase [Planococcus salinus]
MKVFIETTDTENYRWIDARYDLGNPKVGRELYETEHVKGAVFWDLGQDLSDMSSAEGRHPMPSKEQLTELFRQSGLDRDDSIVVYDQGGSAYAARAWWLLKYAGFENVYIDRNGFEQLKNQGIDTDNEIPKYPRSEITPEFNEAIYATQEDVKSVINGKDLGVLLDARSAERYAGKNEPIDPVAGRIPGAKNYDWAQLVENGKVQPDSDLSSVVQPNEPAIVYCGSGVSAAGLFAVLTETGHDQIRLYTGSFSDWISNKDNVVEIDREEHPEAADDETKAVLARLIEEGYSGEMLMKKFEYEKSLLDENK